MNIKFNYLSNRIKAGIGAFLLMGSLSSCSKVINSSDISNNNSDISISNVLDNDVVYVSLGITKKDLNFSDESREFLENVSNNKGVVFNIKDRYSHDYIENLEVTILNCDGDVVDKFVTGSSDTIVINNFDFDDRYNIIISNLPVEYGNRGSVNYNVRIDYDSLSSDYTSDKDYYKIFYATIILEKERDRILNENGEMLPGEIQVGAFELSNGYIDGVHFSVSDEFGNEVDNWISTKTYHIVYNLPNGNYNVKLLDYPGDYELYIVQGKSSDNFNSYATDYSVTIKDGKYMDKDNVDKSYGGPTFYFTSSEEKILDSNIKTLKK